MNKISKEKFSIRKYKVGATSVLLGTILAVGVFESKTAKASESDTAESKLTQDNKVEPMQKDASSEEVIRDQSIVTDEQIPNEQSKASEETVHDEIFNDKVKQRENNLQNSNKNSEEQLKSETENKAMIKEPKLQEQQNRGEVHEVEQEKQTEDTKEQPLLIQENRNKQVIDINKEVNDSQIKSANQNQQSVNYDTSEETKNKQKVNPETLKINKQVNENKQNQKGLDASSKVIAKDDSQIISENVVNPHRGQRSQLKYNLAFEKGIKPGDYFDFIISNNVNTYGVSARKKVPDIKNGSVVMATGQVLDNGRIRYTFTDFIKDKVNVTAQLSLNLFIDPKVVQKDSQQTITSTLNGKTLSKTINVQHLNGTNHAGVSVNGAIEKINKEENKFSHIAYINPQGNKIQSASIYGRITSGYTTNDVLPTVKVYEYIGNEAMPQSVYADTNNSKLWKDVTEEVKNMLQVSDSQYQLNFDNLEKRYAIRYEGAYQSDAQNLNFQTNITGYPEYYPNYAASATWNNGVVFYQNDANGNGENGHNNGETEEEDSNPIDWEEDTTPDEESGHNNGETEEEDSNPIDWEEDTTPDGENGHNNGKTEEIENNHNNGGSENIMMTKENTTPTRSYEFITSDKINHEKVIVKANNHNTSELIKTNKKSGKDNVEKIKQLPETGNKEENTALFATVLAILGSIFLFKRNRKRD